MTGPPRPRVLAGLLVLTATSGMVDVVGFLALGRVFCALTTGNVLFLGLALAGEAQLAVTTTGLALLAFVVGILTGNRLIDVVTARGGRWFRGAVGAEALLLLVGAAVAWRLAAETTPQVGGRHLAVVALLATAMGVRAATTLKTAVPGHSTILVTTTLALLFREGHGTRAERRNWALAVVSLGAGAAAGGLLLEVAVSLPIAVAAACAAVVAVACVPGREPAAGR
ncbi:YoaK family protein [Streptomyces chumphonensis]|uniref:YoaK family protein n=1 Tax=Streptomyces chumphonensis TaxID=1214925 RepID=UPI003D759F4C